MLDRPKIERKVFDIISEMMNIEVSLSTRLQEDLNADSLDTVEIVMEIEDCFDVEINDDDVSSIKTVEDVVKALIKRLK